MNKHKPKIIAIAFLFLSFAFAHSAHAAATDNVYGSAFSSNIGAISFNNCTTPTGNTAPNPVMTGCSGQNYGVSIGPAPNYYVSGYAWSPSVGWIAFDQNKLTGCPSGSCTVTYNSTTGALSGWAKVCAGKIASNAQTTDVNNSCAGADRADQSDMWISLSGNALYGPYASNGYGANINKTTGQGSGQAWGSDVVGWVDFSGVKLTTTAIVNGACGSANGQPSSTMPAPSPANPPNNLCTLGTSTAVTGPNGPAPGTWNWTCAGQNGGTTASCSASITAVVNGACGSANKIYPFNSSSYGPDTFCNPGTPNPPSPVFPPAGNTTNWSCEGSNTNSTADDASCSASQAMSGAPTVILEAYVNSAPTSSAASNQTFYLGWTGTNLQPGPTNCKITGVSSASLVSYPAPINGISQTFSYPTAPNPKIYSIKCLGTNNTSATSTKTVIITTTPLCQPPAINAGSPPPCTYPAGTCSDPNAQNPGQPLPCTYASGICQDPNALNNGQPMPCKYKAPKKWWEF